MTISAAFLVWTALCGLAGCGSNTPGRMDVVRPISDGPRVGTVYCMRGWTGIYSAGIDEMARKLKAQGINAVVYMPEQYPELAAELVKRYKNEPKHEPICFIGHSRGVDSSLIIARELDKAGIAVDVIACLDSVDEVTVPKNVRVCYNYWMPGVLGANNLLRGIPLVQAPGSTGQLFNYNCDKEYLSWRGPLTDHISFDADPGIQKRIIEHILEACPERSKWAAPSPASVPVASTSR